VRDSGGVLDGSGDPSGGGGDARRGRSAVAVAVWTVLGVVPGVGLIVAGRRRSGVAVLAGSAAAVIAAVSYVGTDSSAVVSRGLDTGALRVGAVAAVAAAVVWSAIIVVSHRALRPATAGSGERVWGALLVGVLCLAVSTPLVIGANVALTARATLQAVFRGGRSQLAAGATVGAGVGPAAGVGPSGTVAVRPSPGVSAAAGGYRWSKPRVSILIIGGDGATGRPGVRTDSMAIASIDTVTGRVLLVSVPRNLCRLQWAPGTALAAAYPQGWVADPAVGCTGDNPVNAIYNDVPAAHPGLFPAASTDNPGADALALGLQYSLRLPIDYYLLVNLTAFRSLVDAIGGVTVDINTPIPVGGQHDTVTGNTVTAYPSRWLMPAPHQHLDGANALWFARGRFSSDDYDRINRQKCVINAIIAQTAPTTLLTSYAALAATLQDNVRTNVPARLLDPLAQLGLKVRRTRVLASLTLRPASPGIPGVSGMGTNDHPVWSAAAAAIAQAITRTDPTPTATAATRVRSPAAAVHPTGTPATGAAVPISTPPAGGAGRPADRTSVTTNVGASCAYNAAAARAGVTTWQQQYGGMYTPQGTRRR